MEQKKPFKFETKKLIILLVIIALIILGVIIIFSFLEERKQPEKLANLENDYNMYCGSCHIVPNPMNIPKSLWKSKVLPEMEKRMGLKHYTDGFVRYSDEEKKYIELNNAYTDLPLIDSLKWRQLYNYIISIAPDSVPNIPNRKGRNSKLTQFKSSFETLNNIKPAGGIVNLKFDSKTNKLLVGDIYGQLYNRKTQSNIELTLNSPEVLTILISCKPVVRNTP